MASISVIIPVYNAADSIEAALDSVIKQTVTELQIICVDDGSTDGTPQILERCRAQDRRIEMIRQENAGAGAARNAGMRAATGEYLSFLDCDDVFEKDMLERMLERCERLDADVCVCDSDGCNPCTGKRRKLRNSFETDLFPKKEVFSALDARENLFGMFSPHPWDKLFRASFVREHGLAFQETRNANDVFFVYGALSKAERITTENQALVHKTLGKGGLSTAGDKKWDDLYLAYLALKEKLVEDGSFEELKRSFLFRASISLYWNMSLLSKEGRKLLSEKLKNGGYVSLGLADERGRKTNPLHYCNRKQFLYQTALRCKSALRGFGS